MRIDRIPLSHHWYLYEVGVVVVSLDMVSVQTGETVEAGDEGLQNN